MRIGLASTLATAVREERAGSVEGLVWLLARDLQRRGHEVVVFASADSTPPCELVAAVERPYSAAGSRHDWQVAEWVNLCRAVEDSARLDVLHAHAYLWGMPLAGLASCPLVHTMHVLPGDGDAALWKDHPDAAVTAVSAVQWEAYPHLRPTAVVPHGIDALRHTFREEHGGYLCYLGRFIPGKGPVEAIDAARALGMPIRLAGPASAYFREAVEPLLDGEDVRYAGYLDAAARDELLGGAAALVYPLRAPEPFGLVIAEAMLSGTPVAALGLGAVPDLVEEGITGAWEPPDGDVAQAVTRCLSLDRVTVRARALERFSSAAMAQGYERVYEQVVAAGGRR